MTGTVFLACIAAVSFPFTGGEIEQVSEQAGAPRSVPGVSKKLGRGGEGLSEKGEGVGRKLPPPARHFLHLLIVLFPSCAFLEHLLCRLPCIIQKALI